MNRGEALEQVAAAQAAEKSVEALGVSIAGVAAAQAAEKLSAQEAALALEIAAAQAAEKSAFTATKIGQVVAAAQAAKEDALHWLRAIMFLAIQRKPLCIWPFLPKKKVNQRLFFCQTS